MGNFTTDLNSGKKYEDFIKHLLIDYGFTYISNSNEYDKRERKQYDLKMMKDGKEVYIEVKSDIYEFETGNEIFEFNCNKIQSGIMTTTADYWVTCSLLLNRITIYKVKHLKPFCEECIKGSDKAICRNVGDRNAARAVLANHDEMKTYITKRLDIYVELPIYNPYDLIKHFEKEKPQYKKIIKKLKELFY